MQDLLHNLTSQSRSKRTPLFYTPSSISKIEKILGTNFHGEDSWTKLGVRVKTPALSKYPKLTEKFLESPSPFDADLKISESGTLVIMAAYESINSFQRLTNFACKTSGKSGPFYGGDWRQSERFATECSTVDEFHFVLNDIAPGSLNSTFDEARMVIPQGSGLMVANACGLVAAVGMQWIYSNKRYQKYARTSDTTSSNYRVIVGHADERGTFIDVSDDETHSPNIGLALCWDLATY